jgi:hypothetical protein
MVYGLGMRNSRLKLIFLGPIQFLGTEAERSKTTSTNGE